MCVCTNMCTWCLWRAFDTLELEFKGGACGCWKPSQGLLQEQQVLFTTELSTEP